MTRTPTVLLAIDERSVGDIHNRRPRMRVIRADYAIYGVECPYDPTRLTDRARALLASGWRSTVDSGDDLMDTPLLARRRSCSVTHAAEPIIAAIGVGAAQAAIVRKRARDIACAYGDDEVIDTYHVSIGAAPVEALDDATDYINRIAERPGLVACGDPPEDVGATPWVWMLARQEVTRVIAA